MNVLFITLVDIWSLAESGIYTDLMREFVANGHNVAVVSPTASRELARTTTYQEEKALIVKLQSGSIQKTSVIPKTLNTIALDARLRHAIASQLAHIKFDAVLYTTPPVTITKAIKFVKARDKARTYLLLKDIFPQGAVDLGMLSKRGIIGLAYRYFRAREKELYSISDYMGCMSQANVDYLLAHNPGIAAERVEVCPNSLDPAAIMLDDQQKTHWRARYDLPQDKPVFVYGGNIGKPQGVDFIIDCLKANEAEQNAFFLIVGAGTEFSRLEGYFNTAAPRHARLIRHLPREEYDLVCAACDAGLIFLDHRFTIPNFPSRLLSYMQAAMPVLAATDRSTDLGAVIEKGGFGFWCESTDVNIFLSKVQRLCDPALRRTMGQAAREYLEKHYTAKQSYNVIIKHFTGGKPCSTTKPF